jgi:DNA-directed RNA polymerase specialized sigma subunit
MRTRTIDSIVKKLQKGKTLREIATQYGISNQKVWRIGASKGVYSVRSTKA